MSWNFHWASTCGFVRIYMYEYKSLSLSCFMLLGPTFCFGVPTKRMCSLHWLQGSAGCAVCVCIVTCFSGFACSALFMFPFHVYGPMSCFRFSTNGMLCYVGSAWASRVAFGAFRSLWSGGVICAQGLPITVQSHQ